MTISFVTESEIRLECLKLAVAIMSAGLVEDDPSVFELAEQFMAYVTDGRVPPPGPPPAEPRD